MGTTFYNLQIKIKKAKIPESMIPETCLCVQTAEEWTSVLVVSDSFAWEKLCALGRWLSRKLETPVIAVSYLDDDAFSMSLLAAGRTAASYRTAALRSNCRGSANWIEELEFRKEEACAFRSLVKKEMTAGESIAAFSRLIGAQMDMDAARYQKPKTLWRKDSGRLIEEIEEEKKANGARGATRARLLMEIPGLYESYDEITGVIRMVYPDGAGGFLYRRIHCMKADDEGLHEIFDFRYPTVLFKENSRCLQMDYEHKEIQVLDQEGHTQGYKLSQYEKAMEALMTDPGSRNGARISPVDITPVYTQYTVDNGRYEYWGGPSEPVLRKVDLHFSGKTSATQRIVAVYRYEESENMTYFWKPPILLKDGIVCVRVRYSNRAQDTECDVRFFDRTLHLQRREKIRLQGEKLFPIAYCEETDCMYMGSRRVNLRTHRSKQGDRELSGADRLFIHYNAEHKGFLYAIRENHVFVYDLNLKCLSSHRLKGKILYYYRGKDGDVRLITAEDIVFDMGRPDRNSAVRVYRIEAV